MAKHLVDLYKPSGRGQEGNVETNFVEETSPLPNLDVSDYHVEDLANG